MEKEIKKYLALNENKFSQSTLNTLPSKLRCLAKLGFDPETCFNALKQQGYSLYTIKVYFMSATRFEREMFGTTRFNDWYRNNVSLFRQAYSTDKVLPTKSQIDEVIFNPYLPKEFRNLMILMAYAGLRFSEASSLKWSDIQDQVIRVKGKGGKTRRVQIHTQYYELLKKNAPDSQKVAAIGVGTLRRIWKNLSLPFTPHDSRAFYISYLLNDLGFSICEVQKLVGHSNISTTNLYVRTSEKELFEKVNRRMGDLR